MTYNVFGETLSLTQSVSQSSRNILCIFYVYCAYTKCIYCVILRVSISSCCFVDFEFCSSEFFRFTESLAGERGKWIGNIS